MSVLPGTPEPSPIDDAWELTRGVAATAEQAGAAEPIAPAGAAPVYPPPAPLPDNPTIADVSLRILDEPAGPSAPAESVSGERIGIVFVHGIGSQRATETLFDWAAPIVRTVWAWSEWRAAIEKRPFRDPVDWAQVDLTGRTTPLIQLAIPAVAGDGVRQDIPPQFWIMTEAWWAADVRPAGIGEMVAWSRKHVGTIIEGVVNGIRMSAQTRPEDPNAPDMTVEELKSRPADPFDRLAIGGLFTVAAAIASPIYLTMRALQSLPIPGLKGALNTGPLDWFLSEWFGDVRILLHDRAQSANLRMRLATTIEKVRNYGAERIVIVAHSGGTVLSYMMLADPAHDDLQVDKFITHGQAIGLAWKVGGRDLKERLEFDEGLRSGDRLLRPVHREAEGRRWPRWVDFHATHDIAAAFNGGGWHDKGAERPPNAPPDDFDFPDEGRTVANRMSLVNDHGGYWDNDEQFVIPLLRELDTPDGTWSDSRFYPPHAPGYTGRVVDRESRVRALARWWNAWMVLLAAALVVGLIASFRQDTGLSALGRGTAPLVDWIPLIGILADLPRWLLGAIVVIVLFYAIIAAFAVDAWNVIDVKERAKARTFGREPVKRHRARGRMLLLLTAAVAGVVMAIAPGLAWDIVTVDLPSRVPFDLWIGINAFIVAVVLIVLSGVERVAVAVGRATAGVGWLPETQPEPETQRLPDPDPAVGSA